MDQNSNVKNEKNTMERDVLFLKNNSDRLDKEMKKRPTAFRISPKLRVLYKRYLNESSIEKRNVYCAAVLDEWEKTWIWRRGIKKSIALDDRRVCALQNGIAEENKVKKSDYNYYSVAVIVKNEARFLKEFILFYQATGAEKIYLYDNDSTDNLLEVINPFLESGFVEYRFIHGSNVQCFVYRDAVRRARGRTKWLAIVDADEFLFSPKGKMPEQLKAYEEYPGVGVNWVMYGPNGHDTRPEGLVMDNYTTALADHDAIVNCHIKSIVQPARVDFIVSPHYAVYKGGRNAVNECKEAIGNRNAYAWGLARAFTYHNNREIFRINHYVTKSLEDLRFKCARGVPSGAPNPVYENMLAPFRETLEDDYSIKEYADIVREKYGDG